MVLNQIECPPTKSKQNIGQLFNKWMPEMEKYAVDYVGLGDIAGTTSNKRAKKTAIGTNKFISIGGKCDNTSDPECIGKDRYVYYRSYPFGFIPNCTKKDNNYEITSLTNIPGGTALMGGIAEDIINLNIADTSKSFFGKGPLSSKKCMKARLPVGNGLLVDGRRFDTKEQALDNGRGWYVEEQCIPKGPTYNKTYGGELFQIPISESRCKEEFTQKSETRTISKYIYILLVFGLLILSLIGTKYNKKTGKVCFIFIFIFIIFLFFGFGQ